MPTTIAAQTACWRPLAVCWLVHGGLLLVLALIAPLIAQQTHDPLWIELMSDLGYRSMIPAMQRLMDVLMQMRGWLFAVAGLCLGIGGWAWWGRVQARWGLHALAVAHLVLVPWASWHGHVALSSVNAGLVSLLSEIVTVVASEIALIAAIVIVERAHRRERAAASAVPAQSASTTP